MNVLVFDIEAVPDVEAGRRLYSLEGLTDQEVANVMFTKRYQETGGKNEILRHPLYRVIVISAVLRTADRLRVWSLGRLDSPEEELISRFFEGIERYTPLLVSWNGPALISRSCTTAPSCMGSAPSVIGKMATRTRAFAGTIILAATMSATPI